MQRLLLGLVVSATTALMPTLAIAGNQEVANRIAGNLRDSGMLVDYKIGVKHQNGVTWLTGRVRSQEQLSSALKLVSKTPGVTRVINNLKIQATAEAEPAAVANESTLQFSQAQKASHSQPLTAAERLARVIAGGGEQEPLQPAAEPAAQPAAGIAEKVPNSFQAGQIQPVAGTRVPRAIHPRVAGRPIPIAYTQPVQAAPAPHPGAPMPAYVQGAGGTAPARYDQPHLPNYSWPSYAAYPNYAALTYPRQYSPAAWPYIGPFYPYPQVPLGWRKVTLEWDDGWWMLDFKDR